MLPTRTACCTQAAIQRAPLSRLPRARPHPPSKPTHSLVLDGRQLALRPPVPLGWRHLVAVREGVALGARLIAVVAIGGGGSGPQFQQIYRPAGERSRAREVWAGWPGTCAGPGSWQERCQLLPPPLLLLLLPQPRG